MFARKDIFAKPSMARVRGAHSGESRKNSRSEFFRVYYNTPPHKLQYFFRKFQKNGDLSKTRRLFEKKIGQYEFFVGI